MASSELLRIRDVFPLEAISCAAIREAIAADGHLSKWTRETAGAPRPFALARALRHSIWQAMDHTLATLDDRLAAGKGCAGFRITFDLPDRHVVTCEVQFERPTGGAGKGRIVGHVVLGAKHPIASNVYLRTRHFRRP
ncbi:hypothetical protein [Novosphingobium sp. PC22D]|uniref:hypothetical protein n=1 Tax=Novosphingobium sp. PC22D TaxID=1962403 RepID=UPI0011453817|nr:hypothetical protein [Novosphingobium sp. PC22D]